MSWNYRVLQHPGHDGVPYYQIHEVYYSEGGDIESWTAKNAGPCGSSPLALEHNIELFKMALTKPILKTAFEGDTEILVVARPAIRQNNEAGYALSSDHPKPRRPGRLKGEISGEFLSGL
ncbi:MAG: hypothetical protein ACSHWQ_08880 [Spongiibacteraceae bacterium]